MKAYLVAVLVGIVLISVVLATVSARMQNQSDNLSQQTRVSQSDTAVADEVSLPGSAMGITPVTFDGLIHEVITVILMAAGSIAVLKKKK